MNRTLIALALAATCTGVATHADDHPRQELPTGSSVASLIEALGNDKQRVRDEAQRRLLGIPGALPALRRAMGSKDPEVATRAARVVGVLLPQRYLREIESGGVDLFAERLINMSDPLECDAGWQAMLDLGGILREREKQDFGKIRQGNLEHFPQGSFAQLTAKARYTPITKPNSEVEIAVPDPYLIRAAKIKSRLPLGSGMYSVSNGIDSGGLSHLIVLSGGSVRAEHAVSATVLVCDGDVSTFTIRNSIVVARGAVVTDHCAFSLVVCSGTFTKKDRLQPVHESTIKADEAKFLGLVKFFETSQVGIEGVQGPGGTRVTKIGDGSPFARAGVSPGDLIIAIDGAAASSVEVFRRLLRAKVALGVDTVLKIKRAGKDMDVRVLFGEPSAAKTP